MKGFITFLILVAIVVVGYFVLRTPAEAPTAPDENTSDALPAGPDNENDVDESLDGAKDFNTEASMGNWTGSKKIIKTWIDKGTINIKSGNATFAKGVLTGGEVVFDMTTIAALSTGAGGGQDRLSADLKSDNFFDVAKYPEAKFVITDAVRESGTSYMITGDLTVKGKTAPISFTADVVALNGVATISGMATIDRTVYDVRFGSEKFFSDLGDNVINDEFTLEFKAVTE